VFNVGSGQDRSILEIGTLLASAMGRPDLAPETLGKARAGDIRHCFCDAGTAREVLGFTAAKDFSAGLAELAEWVARQAAHDGVDEARRELEKRGLVA
jgi:dTDP-L-rhamnose 4-epimerase